MIKIIAADMDGTLLDENSEVPEETFGLIHELHQRGHHLCRVLRSKVQHAALAL